MLRSLVTVRVSQLNWCRFCVDINAMTLVKRAGSSDKVEALARWRDSPLFDEAGRAVLDYAEAMTGLDGVSDESRPPASSPGSMTTPGGAHRPHRLPEHVRQVQCRSRHRSPGVLPVAGATQNAPSTGQG